MRSGRNNCSYFPGNKLTKLANLEMLKRTPMSCLEDWGRNLAPVPLIYSTVNHHHHHHA